MEIIQTSNDYRCQQIKYLSHNDSIGVVLLIITALAIVFIDPREEQR